MTALLKYINLFARFLLAVFDTVLLHGFSCDTARKCVNFKAIIPEDHYSGIIPYHPFIFQKIFRHNVRMPSDFGRRERFAPPPLMPQWQFRPHVLGPCFRHGAYGHIQSTCTAPARLI